MKIWLALLFVLVPFSSSAQVLLTDDEIAQVLSYGPWPPTPSDDPSNRVSGNPAAIALGEKLFFDPILSADGTMACASCHNPSNGFGDGLPRGEGRVQLDRNTPTLWNLVAHRWFGWAGDTDNLWAQSITPILNPAEMAHDADGLKGALSASEHVQAYQSLFGDIDAHSPEDALINVGKALAAFQETLVTGKTPFDLFVDALAKGDVETASAFSQSAQRGLKVFFGEGRCAFCHVGPALTSGEFNDVAVPYFLSPTEVDSGRFGGLKALLQSPYTLDGDYSDDPERSEAWAVRSVRQLHSDFGTFRVPSLRNVALTAPYMHDGSLPDLRSVVIHYSTIDMERLHADGESILSPFALTTGEVDDLVAFLESLTELKRD